MQWTLFATLFDNIGPPVIAAVDGLIRVLQGWVRPVILAGLLLYVPGRLMWASLRGNGDGSLNDMLTDLVAGGIFLYLATEVAGYGPYVRNVLLNGVSSEIGRLLVGLDGNRPVSGAIFDEIWNRAWVAGLAAYRNLPWSMAGFGLAILIVVYWFISIIGILVAFVVWLTSFVMVALLVGLGPLFMAMFAFPWTRGIAWGWLRTTISNVLLQVFAVALLTLLLGAITRILAQIYATTGVNTAANEIMQLQMLLGGSVVFLTSAWLAYQMPGAAASIAHGFTGFNQVPRFGWTGGFGKGEPAGGSAGGGPGGGWSGGRSTLPPAAAPAPAPAPPPVFATAPPGRSLG